MTPHRLALTLIGLTPLVLGAAPARADTLSVTLVAYPGQELAPGVTALFSLNPDGTIAAKAISLGGPLFQFAMSIPSYGRVLNHDFSMPARDSSYFSTWFGQFDSGWVSIDTRYTSPTTVTRTIGTPGMFTSVAGAFSDNWDGYALFAYAIDGVTPGSNITQWGWSSGIASDLPPVPEPGTFWLALAGLMAVAPRVWRKAHRPHREPKHLPGVLSH